MPHICEDCGHGMRVRDEEKSAGKRHVLSWACDLCGNVEVASTAARIMREETHAAAKRYSARAKVQKLPDGTISVNLNRQAAEKIGLSPGCEVVLRGANGHSFEVARR